MSALLAALAVYLAGRMLSWMPAGSVPAEAGWLALMVASLGASHVFINCHATSFVSRVAYCTAFLVLLLAWATNWPAYLVPGDDAGATLWRNLVALVGVVVPAAASAGGALVSADGQRTAETSIGDNPHGFTMMLFILGFGAITWLSAAPLVAEWSFSWAAYAVETRLGGELAAACGETPRPDDCSPTWREPWGFVPWLASVGYIGVFFIMAMPQAAAKGRNRVAEWLS